MVLGENALGERWFYQDSTDNADTEARDRWLPLIASNRISNEINIQLPDNQRFKNNYLSVNLISVSPQTRLAVFRDVNQRNYPTPREFAAPPAGYHRFDASAGTTWLLGKQKMEVSLTVENIFNTRYRDYLNRLRFFADELGRNFTLRMKTIF
ncbi:MAG: TonB-dependent receptor [Saprospiraceae bacterium]|nr:TonB-dependent receptor [Saprospiraceae bacterium]